MKNTSVSAIDDNFQLCEAFLSALVHKSIAQDHLQRNISYTLTDSWAEDEEEDAVMEAKEVATAEEDEGGAEDDDAAKLQDLSPLKIVTTILRSGMQWLVNRRSKL
jgi:hypothetical protein